MNRVTHLLESLISNKIMKYIKVSMIFFCFNGTSQKSNVDNNRTNRLGKLGPLLIKCCFFQKPAPSAQVHALTLSTQTNYFLIYLVLPSSVHPKYCGYNGLFFVSHSSLRFPFFHFLSIFKFSLNSLSLSLKTFYTSYLISSYSFFHHTTFPYLS